ncbi:LSU ribosomal protein L10p (P0) [hydrothermal vent metagenome]|uniref:LSU ribosomal protein L10p (P0) n=1 Tax=hydrothermal vent metagenome TaxID=652676 RepID=A0A3B1E437_9ZZZZ
MKKVGKIFREGLVNRIKNDVQQSDGVFLLSYSCLSSSKLTDFRKNLYSAGASVNVAKNSIARIALKDLEYSELAEKVSDQTAFVYTKEEAPKISKILIEFADDCEGVDIQGGVLDGKILEKTDVKRLSELPSKEVLLAMLLGTIQAPVTQLLGALNAKSRDLLSILKQLSEKKGGN